MGGGGMRGKEMGEGEMSEGERGREGMSEREMEGDEI